MGASRFAGLHAVKFDPDSLGGSSAVIIGGVTQQSINTGTEIYSEATSGEVDPRFQSMVSQEPGAVFSSYHIKSWLDNVGQGGGAIEAASNDGVSLYAKYRSIGSTRKTGGNNREYNFQSGIIVPQSLTVEHRGNAVISYRIVARYDGTNDPLIITDSVTLPAITGDAERFTLYAAQLESVAITHMRGFTWDFGIELDIVSSDSDVWASAVSIKQQQQMFTFRGIDPEWLKSANIPLAGKAITHANTLVELRKRAAGGTYVADATEEHISLTAAGTAYVENAFDASGNELGECNIMVPLLYDGTNTPVVIDTTAALSL